MDTSQYLDLFIDETKEHLQSLNEHVLVLEKEPENEDTINEIFRAAHTLKGMSGTMGFVRMQRLTHDLENVFSEIRNGNMKVNEKLIDVLFRGLDALESYLAVISSEGNEGTEDNEDIINDLNALLEEQSGDGAAAPAQKEVKKEETPAKEEKAENKQESASDEKCKFKQIPISEYEATAINSARAEGKNVYGITVYLQKTCILKSARAFLVFKSVENKGELIKSVPSTEQIEDEEFDFDFSWIFASSDTKENIKKLLFENETISLAQYNSYAKKLNNTEFVELNHDFMLMRNKKEAFEIELMKKANNIAEKSFLELLNEVKIGKTEKELAALFDYIMARNGSEGVSFDTILLTGTHTSMPHGVPSDKKIKDGDFVLFDFGATYQGYHSDMTRTIAIGNITDEMKEAYDLVLKAQLAGIKALKAGEKCADVYQAAYDVLNEKDMGKYFRHSLGHGVGLDIHEGYNASPKSNDKFEVGNVTSIEPGIYIPDKFGIRIEDLLYISPRGRENLSKVTKKLIIL